ncbi:MAG TPA: PAS domain S-box protein, partial [Kofleriaceae bacterium]|nr:PAS domain S-box protein [Kofleriaceae bacterium]
MRIDLPFRQLVDAAPDGMVVCDQSGTIVLVNAETERMFGYARDELIGKRIEALIPERLRARHEGHVSGFASAPRLRPMGSGLELHGRHKDGHEFPVEISLSPIKSDDLMLFTAGIRDVSDRRVLERQARRANAYLTSAVESVTDAFALFDEQDRVMMMNSSARHLLGAVRDSGVVGLTFESVLDNALNNAVF